MRIPIDHRVLPGAVLLLVLLVAFFFLSKPFLVVVLLLLVFHIAFFRDPARELPGDLGPLSPADGTVAEVTPVYEPRFIDGKAVKIGIFLSIFNVHVTRASSGGVVKYLKYEPGKFLNALNEDSVNKNESNWIGIEQNGKKVLIRQIAGVIARRIRCDVKEGSEVARGGKLGIICYGSRAECFVPAHVFRPTVKKGDKVKAGETILGEWLS